MPEALKPSEDLLCSMKNKDFIIFLCTTMQPRMRTTNRQSSNQGQTTLREDMATDLFSMPFMGVHNEIA